MYINLPVITDSGIRNVIFPIKFPAPRNGAQPVKMQIMKTRKGGISNDKTYPNTYRASDDSQM